MKTLWRRAPGPTGPPPKMGTIPWGWGWGGSRRARGPGHIYIYISYQPATRANLATFVLHILCEHQGKARDENCAESSRIPGFIHLAPAAIFCNWRMRLLAALSMSKLDKALDRALGYSYAKAVHSFLEARQVPDNTM